MIYKKAEEKLKDRRYLSKLQQQKYEKIIISRIVMKHENELYDILQTEEILDWRTIDAWKKMTKFPSKRNLEKFRKTKEYYDECLTFIKEIEYEASKYFKRKIIQVEIEKNVVNLSNVIKKRRYKLVRPYSKFWSDEIEFAVFYDELFIPLITKHQNLIKRVEGLRFKDISDLQSASTIDDFLDFYEKHPNANILLDNFFSKQFRLFSRFLDQEIGFNEFSSNLEKLMKIVYAIVEIESED